MAYDFASWDAGLHGEDPNALVHYGVLGMKWGMRRYQNQDGSLTAAGERHYQKTGEKGYHYHSHATKKYTRKAEKQQRKADEYRKMSKEFRGMKNDPGDLPGDRNSDWAKKTKKWADKYQAKADKYKNRAKRSAEIDKGEEEYARGISTRKALALKLIGGARKSYQQYRAMSGQKGKDLTGQKIMSYIKGNRAGTIGSRLSKAYYIRQDEKRGAGQTLYNVNKRISDTGANIINNLIQDPNKKRRR